MSATISITPQQFLNWPVLDEDPEEGVTAWLQFDEDFLGYRMAVKFPFLPMETYEKGVYATNTPIIGVVTEKPKHRNFWICSGFSIWSEKEKGICLFNNGKWDDHVPVNLHPCDQLKINTLKVVVR